MRDPDVKAKLARRNRQAWQLYGRLGRWLTRNDPEMSRVLDAVQWQADHFEEIPVTVVACLRGPRLWFPPIATASYYGSVFPSVQNLLLAARAVNLGAALITLPLWSTWSARRLTDAVDGFLSGHRVLICDRDRKWTDGFHRIVQGAGVRIVLTPVQAPNANAHAERFVRSICGECLDRLILFGEGRRLRALDEVVAHDHGERNHQGLGNELITPEGAGAGGTQVRCRERLGGLLRYYHRAA